MLDLSYVKNEIVIIRHGKYYGCVQDKSGTVFKKGFETREEARAWISNKEEYPSRWTE